MQLVSKIATAGGQVVPATSSYSDLDVYAVMQANGDLGLLVINTNPAAAITDQFNITGFQPGGPAQVWQYGKAQDTAQSLTLERRLGPRQFQHDLKPDRSELQLHFPGLFDDGARLEAGPDGRQSGGGDAEFDRGHDRGTERPRWLQRRRKQPDLHLVNDRHATGAGFVLRQWHQRGQEHSGHVQ